jgi:hypothetical protein
MSADSLSNSSICGSGKVRYACREWQVQIQSHRGAGRAIHIADSPGEVGVASRRVDTCREQPSEVLFKYDQIYSKFIYTYVSKLIDYESIFLNYFIS